MLLSSSSLFPPSSLLLPLDCEAVGIGLGFRRQASFLEGGSEGHSARHATATMAAEVKRIDEEVLKAADSDGARPTAAAGLPEIRLRRGERERRGQK